MRISAVIAGLVLGAAAALTSTGAQAHELLVDSSPRAGDVLASGPSQITLTFSDRPLDDGAVVAVMDAASRDWAGPPPVMDDVNVTVPLADALPDGRYEVVWRVVSGDGHPISGSYTFQVGDGGSAGPAPGADDPVQGEVAQAEGSAAAASVVWALVLAGLASLLATVLLWRRAAARRRLG